MKNIKFKIVLYILAATTVITLLSIYSRAIAAAVAPIAEFTVALML